VLRLVSLSIVAVARVNETLPSLSFLSMSGFLAIVPSTSARLIFIFLCLEALKAQLQADTGYIEQIDKSTNQKKELPVAVMFVNGSKLNEQYL
jgi:hypothetical protein